VATPTITLPVYLSRRRAAAILDCSLFTLDALIRSGRLPVYRLGERSLRLNLTDVEALLVPVQPPGVDQ
jgi:excisionase family DNA binding protein